MKIADEVLRKQLEDPACREAWKGTTMADTVANQAITFLAQHGLSQAALARILNVGHTGLARLEPGEHEPNFAALPRLPRRLGLQSHMNITPNASELMAQGIDAPIVAAAQ